MCGRRVSQVKFDEAGYQSIESECFLYEKDKWKLVYALCTQPSDFRSVILYIYRNYKHRLKKKELLSFASDTFFGIESGFELHKKTNTLSLITSKQVLTLSFLTVEHFTLWDCWLDAAYSKGALFFGQLVKAPLKSKAYSTVNREIRIYIHNYGFALATGRPLRLIGYWMIDDIKSIDFFPYQLHFSVNRDSGADDGRIRKTESDYGYGYSNNYASIADSDDCIYKIICWQIKQLKEAYFAAKEGRLRALLGKKSESASWLGDNERAFKIDSKYRDFKADTAIDHFNKRYEATYYNEVDLLMPKSRIHDWKQEKGFDDTLPGILKTYDITKRHEPTISETSAEGPEAVQEHFECYVNVKNNEDRLKNSNSSPADGNMQSSASAVKNRVLTSSEQSFQPFNDATTPTLTQSCHESATSLPALSGRTNITRTGSWPKSEYELFREMRTTDAGSHAFLRSGRSQGDFYLQADVSSPLWQTSGTAKEIKGKYVKQTFRSSKTAVRGTRSFRDKKCLRRCHQRSMSAAIEPTVKRSSSTREESWNRAKRIIGSTRRSSERSTTTLASRQTSERDMPNVSNERISRLDLSVNVENNERLILGFASTSTADQKVSPIPGLIKLPKQKFNLKKESYSFAKNLRRLITGSYSKYDGERTTQSDNPQNKDSESRSKGLEAAIDKGRARFIEAQRRRFGFQESNEGLCHNELGTQQSSITIDYNQRDEESNALPPVTKRCITNSQINFGQQSCRSGCVNVPGTSESDSKIVPPPIPERTYKKRLKPTQNQVINSLNQNSTTVSSSSKKEDVGEPSTSYMMVNEAADQFLSRLRKESPLSQSLQLDETTKRKAFGIHFHRKSSYGN